MIFLIFGASHTGKTHLAQRLLERLHIPYLSQDHLKMGLIRSGETALTPMEDERLTDYLWPITREIIKTAIENRQSLIVEGCYIPANWTADLNERYRREIRALAIVMSKTYIDTHKEDIAKFACIIEARQDDAIDFTQLIADNAAVEAACKAADMPFAYIDTDYETNVHRAVEEWLHEQL